LVVNSVTTRLLVLPVPTFFSVKSTITSSSGSITPLVGVQLSATKVAPLVTRDGAVTVRLTARAIPAAAVMLLKSTDSE
jgi:hypothetical protein